MKTKSRGYSGLQKTIPGLRVISGGRAHDPEDSVKLSGSVCRAAAMMAAVEASDNGLYCEIIGFIQAMHTEACRREVGHG